MTTFMALKKFIGITRIEIGFILLATILIFAISGK